MTAVYRLYDAADDLLYVGCTDHLAERLRCARRRWSGQIARVDVTDFPERTSALAAEAHAIQTEAPRANIQWRGGDRMFALRNRITGGALERLLRASRPGVSFREIADQLSKTHSLHVSHETVRRWCIELGIEDADAS